MSDNILEIKNLCTSFGSGKEKVQILNGVTFNVERNKILGIVGESGSGKSVTMNSVMKLLGKNAHFTGSILYNGQEIINYSNKQMREIRGGKIAMVFQDPMTSLNPVYTIGDQIMEAIKLHGKNVTNIKDRAIEVLEQVGINDATRRLKQYPHELSGGMRQRVVIAMALACEPEVLIADEPTTALDVTVQAQILELIKKLTHESNMTTILITHDLGVIVEMCDRVIIMYGGRICEKGSVRDIFYNAKNEYTRNLLEAVPGVNGKKKLVAIEGTPANPKAMPKGCAFCPRCKKAMKICLESVPEEKIISEGHVASCWINEIPENVPEGQATTEETQKDGGAQ